MAKIIDTPLNIRFTNDAWEWMYGALAWMAERGVCVQVTTKDGTVHDGSLDAVTDTFDASKRPTLTIREVPGGDSMDVIATVPLYTEDDSCNIVDIFVH